MIKKHFDRQVVLCHGVFDVIHHGHIAHFEAAKAFGDHLIVNIVADEYVDKGPGRPVFTDIQRKSVLEALTCIDEVRISHEDGAVSAILDIRPEFYVKGIDYKSDDLHGMLDLERAAVESYGGELKLTDTVKDSSSRAIRQLNLMIPQLAIDWLNEHLLTWNEVEDWIDGCEGLEFTCIGEPIRDIYVYVEPRYKSPKEHTITYVPTGEKSEYSGGIDAVGAHLQSITGVSPQIPYGVRLGKVIKTRRVSPMPTQFKVYSECEIKGKWPHHLKWTSYSDNVVAADFGHGLFDNGMLEAVQERAAWLALTVQANSMNWGFNTLQKWSGADYVVVDDGELAMATGQPLLPLDVQMRSEMDRLDASAMAVTQGHNGATFIREGGLLHVPAFTDRPVDRLGAGDAFLGWTAPLVRVDAPLPVVALVGACAAALHVQTPGNVAVKLSTLKGFIRSVLA